MLRVIEAVGDYYECGRIFGEACRESITYRLDLQIPHDLVEKHKATLKEVNERCEKWYPEYVRELEGIAEGSGADYWRLLLLNTPEIMERASGCTSIAVVKDSQQYLVHNEDGNGKERTEDCVILRYTLPTGSFYAFTYAGEIAGGSYSWNSDHLYFSVNYLKPIDPDVSGRVSRNFVARKVIEAKSIDDALEILRNGNDASGYHYYMGQGDRLVSIENFRNEVSIKEISNIDVHANHYLHSKFERKVPHKEHTEVRQKRAEALVAQNADPLHILADRQNAPLAICTEQNEALHTISTFAVYPKENKVVLYQPETLEVEATYQL